MVSVCYVASMNILSSDVMQHLKSILKADEIN
jgi:hypothetical protein